ncbi:MAG: hypothetical protein JXB50_05375 [Spirochaetes bacterium]|nr:hypothetical protein [Spirochaetota bacterium]
MDLSLESILESTNLPESKPWMNNVIYVFINGIPDDCHQHCIAKGENNEIKKEDLAKFVRERLQVLAEREYKLWINGRMPYITPRELQLWRLRQFVQYIWFWNLPDDNDLAMIFNETKRKASNLINDFIARFRKTLLFPIALRRLYVILKNEPMKKEIPHKDKSNVNGNIYSIINKRYIHDCNMLIHELRIRLESNQALSDSYFYDPDINQIWVDSSVVEIVCNHDKIIKDIFKTYPKPEPEQENE